MKQTVIMNEQTSQNLITKKRLLQISGVLGIVGGLLYILIQFIHPEETLAQVSTVSWVIVSVLSMIMSLCILIGVCGLYLNKVERINVLGFIGMILFNIFWFLSIIFSFNEAFVYPLLTRDAPMFLEGMLSLFGNPIYVEELGVFPLLTSVAGGLYILGSILLGITLTISKVYPKWMTILLTLSAIATIGASFVPHPIDRLFALPMGVAFIGFGYEVVKKNKH